VKQSNTRLLTIFLTILFISTVVSAQDPAATAKVETDRGKETAAKTTGKPVTVAAIQKDMREALAVIQGNYAGQKSINYNDVFKSSIYSLLHTLDPHSSYYDAKEFEAFKTSQSSRYFGIGATIGDLSDPNGDVIATYIKATFDGAPAHKAGLRYGDKIVEVNGTSMLGKPFIEVRGFLRGPEGTVAKIVVERLGTGKRETVEITRGSVPQPSISEAYMIRPGVGYIAMRGGFNTTTYGEFIAAMSDLKAAGMQQLVIDLRDNGGGLVSQAHRITNTFLSEGQTVLTQKGRIEGVTERLVARNRNPDRSPVVILVNRNSASASEILAGALQDHDRALIVGENTFGKGLVQNPFPLEDGSMLLLTIAKYETPSGRLIQRDYSNVDLHTYMKRENADDDESAKPKGAESKTDSGRPVFAGGGLTPDIVVKPKPITTERIRHQQRLANPVFAFASELVLGKVKGFENYKIEGPIKFEYDLKSTDFPVIDTLYSTFKQFAVDKYKYTTAQVDREREFVERALRSELITAAYGMQTSFQVSNEYDEQLLKGIELLPQAKQLALQGERARLAGSKSTSPINQ
jgi:carboxyl-terminal processing protease